MDGGKGLGNEGEYAIIGEKSRSGHQGWGKEEGVGEKSKDKCSLVCIVGMHKKAISMLIIINRIIEKRKEKRGKKVFSVLGERGEA